ncbi:MAG: N-acetyl sugar amidotransferase [Candidatus Omnitrophica bacterium]|nr:N-acetyl sugar amidotransferase [Candidatus Omnitrophota bacterium]MBU1995858.1 N-acetyl sugar amidotransferase [Candidatus Omnitrophota bacterium]
MKYCKKCVQPDTRPGLKFDSKGVCLPCNFAVQAEGIDWEERLSELKEIAEFGKQRNSFGYDCIVGVSGGKDSTRQAMYVRDELGMNPLLVSLNYPPEEITELGVVNISNMISLGFDCISISPNSQIWRGLMREGFFRHGNIFKASEMALYASAPRVAIAYHIPLIFLGENPAISYGALEIGSVSGDANRMKHANTLKGGPEAVLPENATEKDLFWYRFPDDEEMGMASIKMVFLGYYIKDFNNYKNAEFAIEHGLKIRNEPSEDIGDIDGFDALDDDFVIVNQVLKHLKFGFGKVTDNSCEAIRLGIMTRNEAIENVKKYDAKCADIYIKKLCHYLEITEEKFWEVAESFRNKEIWDKNKSGEWVLKCPLE